ncbi:MAG: DUF523 and DUF1722 domain-containing protein [Chitinivibrionia bacterium]|nr:DUF523 and DUF1722 domain-containing protein [Chitinivibrionia bacterium]
MSGNETKIKLGISSCLLGEKVRYDGGHKRDPFLTDTLGRFVEWVPVCPEVECGLPVPRESMRLQGDPAHPRLVTTRTGIDHTQRMLQWSKKRIAELQHEDLCGFIFKSKSPSSGLERVKVYNESGTASKTGVGMFAKQLLLRFPLLPAEDEGRLNDPRLRENFIERVFVYRRWNDFLAAGGSARGLVDFHTRHKLLLLAHSPAHLRMLGALVANPRTIRPSGLRSQYAVLLMEALALQATARKNTNVLQHIAGYFKKDLPARQKREIQEVIETYHRSLVPLIVPIVLLQHFVRTYNKEYLKAQYYLNPHPVELMLRNHV